MTASETPGAPITEDELHAYVDGQLTEAARRAAVERYLKQNPEMAVRVRAYDAHRAGLRRAFDWRAAEPIPPELNLQRLVETRLARGSGSRRLAFAASVALSLGLGGALGWTARDAMPTEPTVAARTGVIAVSAEALATHQVFAGDGRHPVEFMAAQRGELLRWLSDRLGRPIAIPDLTPLGYRFMGGRLVAAERGPAALLMYDDGRGTRLTIYARTMADPNETTRMHFAERESIGAWSWADHGVGYAVSAEALPADSLKVTADAVREQI